MRVCGYAFHASSTASSASVGKKLRTHAKRARDYCTAPVKREQRALTRHFVADMIYLVRVLASAARAARVGLVLDYFHAATRTGTVET